MGPMRRLGALLAVLALVAGTASAQSIGWQDAKDNVLVYAVGGNNALNVIAWPLDAALSPANGSTSPIRSSDGGKTWTTSSFPAGLPPGGARLDGAPTDGRVFYLEWAADFGGGSIALYKTTDAGVTWELVNPRIQTPDGREVGVITVGATPDVLFAGRLDLFALSGVANFVPAQPCVSTDGGKTWRSTPPLEGDGFWVSIHPAASDAQVVYAYRPTSKALYRSANQGATWIPALPMRSAEAIRDVTVDGRDASTVYVRTNERNVITTDAGATWQDMAPMPISPAYGGFLLADPLSTGRLYLADPQGAIFESRDRGSTWHAVIATAGNGVRPPILSVDGQRRVFFAETPATFATSNATTLKTAEIPLGLMGLASDLWWNPSESGMGWTISEHASGQAFVVWYRYDAQGNPVWYVMPGGTWTDDSTFHGTLYKTHGPPFFQGPFDPAQVSATPIGDATLAFSDGNNAVFTYSLTNGEHGAKSITRQLFGTSAPGDPPSVADLWWNPRESGWGLAINQQGAKVFATWFVYDANGEPTWLVMPSAELRADAGAALTGRYSFGGDLFTTHGPPSTGPFDPAKVVPTVAGTGFVGFSNGTGALQYTVSGQSGQRDISRQPF